MRIERLVIRQLRNLLEIELAELARVNIIHGQNGSGKTSILEAVFCLGFGRSFRTHQNRQMIQSESDAFTVFAELASAADDSFKLGFQRNRQGDSDIRINGTGGFKLSELALHVPVQLMTPEGVELVTDGPKARRQFMDWGLFHVEQSQFVHWQQYNKLLKQRNALLRSGRFEQDGGTLWDKQLARAGEELTSARAAYLEGLNVRLNRYCQRFLPEMNFEFKLMPGWNTKQGDLLFALSERIELDKKQGYTSVGPSKAEWQIKVDGADARERLSRGQLKLLVAALRFVQGEHYREQRGTSCIYLIDDLPAELDAVNQKKFCEVIMETDSQVFVTAIDKSSLLSHLGEVETRLFHVEHGTILDTTTG